jgi:hypothetical protein
LPSFFWTCKQFLVPFAQFFKKVLVIVKPFQKALSEAAPEPVFEGMCSDLRTRIEHTRRIEILHHFMDELPA